MFTGLVEERGRVAGVVHGEGAARLTIAARTVLDGTRLGDSISVDGCCLTVAELDDGGFSADLITETLRVTTLGGLAEGAAVNLERAAALGDRLGSHLVQGHVDGVGTVRAVHDGPTRFVEVEVPDGLGAFVVPKGSITLAGVGLTVVDVDDDALSVGLVPHTLELTTLGDLAPGDRVNLEVDVVAKYVARLLAAGAATPYGGGLGAPSEAGP